MMRSRSRLVMQLQVCLSALALACLPAAPAFAQDAAALLKAPAGATSCSGCHGASGSALPTLSNLTAAQIEDAMTAFSSGTREATLMNRIAKGYSPEETRAIAVWIAAQPAKAGASK